MESIVLRIGAALGVPGLALAVFYLLYRALNLPLLPTEWIGPIVLVFLLLTAAMVFFALYFYRPAGVFARIASPIPQNRQESLNGNWEGQISQPLFPAANVNLRLEVGKKDVQGQIQYADGSAIRVFQVSGSFHSDRFLKLDYAPEDKAAIQFGSCLLELQSDGRTLRGKAIGFGPQSGAIVSGDLTLDKRVRSPSGGKIPAWIRPNHALNRSRPAQWPALGSVARVGRPG